MFIQKMSKLAILCYFINMGFVLAPNSPQQIVGYSAFYAMSNAIEVVKMHVIRNYVYDQNVVERMANRLAYLDQQIKLKRRPDSESDVFDLSRSILDIRISLKTAVNGYRQAVGLNRAQLEDVQLLALVEKHVATDIFDTTKDIALINSSQWKNRLEVSVQKNTIRAERYWQVIILFDEERKHFVCFDIDMTRKDKDKVIVRDSLDPVKLGRGKEVPSQEHYKEKVTSLKSFYFGRKPYKSIFDLDSDIFNRYREDPSVLSTKVKLTGDQLKVVMDDRSRMSSGATSNVIDLTIEQLKIVKDINEDFKIASANFYQAFVILKKAYNVDFNVADKALTIAYDSLDRVENHFLEGFPYKAKALSIMKDCKKIKVEIEKVRGHYISVVDDYLFFLKNPTNLDVSRERVSQEDVSRELSKVYDILRKYYTKLKAIYIRLTIDNVKKSTEKKSILFDQKSASNTSSFSSFSSHNQLPSAFVESKLSHSLPNQSSDILPRQNSEVFSATPDSPQQYNNDCAFYALSNAVEVVRTHINQGSNYTYDLKRVKEMADDLRTLALSNKMPVSIDNTRSKEYELNDYVDVYDILDFLRDDEKKAPELQELLNLLDTYGLGFDKANSHNILIFNDSQIKDLLDGIAQKDETWKAVMFRDTKRGHWVCFDIDMTRADKDKVIVRDSIDPVSYVKDEKQYKVSSQDYYKDKIQEIINAYNLVNPSQSSFGIGGNSSSSTASSSSNNPLPYLVDNLGKQISSAWSHASSDQSKTVGEGKLPLENSLVKPMSVFQRKKEIQLLKDNEAAARRLAQTKEEEHVRRGLQVEEEKARKDQYIALKRQLWLEDSARKHKENEASMLLARKIEQEYGEDDARRALKTEEEDQWRRRLQLEKKEAAVIAEELENRKFVQALQDEEDAAAIAQELENRKFIQALQDEEDAKERRQIEERKRRDELATEAYLSRAG